MLNTILIQFSLFSHSQNHSSFGILCKPTHFKWYVFTVQAVAAHVTVLLRDFIPHKQGLCVNE